MKRPEVLPPKSLPSAAPALSGGAAGPRKGLGGNTATAHQPSTAISPAYSLFLPGFSFRFPSLISFLKFTGPTFLQSKAQTSQLLPIIYIEVRSLSYSLLCIGDSAVTIHLAGGQCCWTEFLNVSLMVSLLYISLTPLLSSPLTHLLLPLIEAHLSANCLKQLWIYSDIPGIQSSLSSWRHIFQSLLSFSKMSGLSSAP